MTEVVPNDVQKATIKGALPAMIWIPYSNKSCANPAAGIYPQLSFMYNVFSMTPYARKVGEVRPNGDVVNMDGHIAGKVSMDGAIRNSQGKMLGVINRDGKMVGVNMSPDQYSIDLNGNILKDGETVGAVRQVEKGIPDLLANWAACVILVDGGDPGAARTIVSSKEKLAQIMSTAKLPAATRMSIHRTLKKRSPLRIRKKR